MPSSMKILHLDTVIPRERVCKSIYLILQSVVCNGEDNCGDSSDEIGCDLPRKNECKLTVISIVRTFNFQVLG